MEAEAASMKALGPGLPAGRWRLLPQALTRPRLSALQIARAYLIQQAPFHKLFGERAEYFIQEALANVAKAMARRGMVPRHPKGYSLQILKNAVRWSHWKRYAINSSSTRPLTK
jgi:hypothetical protein